MQSMPSRVDMFKQFTSAVKFSATNITLQSLRRLFLILVILSILSLLFLWHSSLIIFIIINGLVAASVRYCAVAISSRGTIILILLLLILSSLFIFGFLHSFEFGIKFITILINDIQRFLNIISQLINTWSSFLHHHLFLLLFLHLSLLQLCKFIFTAIFLVWWWLALLIILVLIRVCFWLFCLLFLDFLCFFIVWFIIVTVMFFI